MRKLVYCMASLALAAGGLAHASTTVGAQSNIYAAGLGSPSEIGSDGVLPVAVGLAPGATALQFTSVTAGPPVEGSPTGGATCVFDGLASSGDGNLCVNNVTLVNAANGYSGIEFQGKTMMLVGLFVGASKSPTAPPTLTYDDAGANAATSFAPLLQQVFFIGDGRTAANALQTFLVPTGAQTLYLGFADAFGFVGDPGFYSDNFGAVLVDYQIQAVPEPAAALMLAAGLAALGWRRRAGR